MRRGSCPYLYGGVCVVFVGRVQGELDLEDLGGTQQQFLPLLCAPGTERVLAVAAALAGPGPAATLRGLLRLHAGFARPVGALILTLVLLGVGGVAVLFSRVPLHVHGFVLPRRGGPGERRGLASAPFGRLGSGRVSFVGVVLQAAEAVSQAADLSDDQVDQSVDQLIEDLQVLVLLEAAETLPADATERRR